MDKLNDELIFMDVRFAKSDLQDYKGSYCRL